MHQRAEQPCVLFSHLPISRSAQVNLPGGKQVPVAVQLDHSNECPTQNGAISLSGGGLSHVRWRLR